MTNTIINLNQEEFTKLKNTAGTYLIDLWAEWCPPCKAMGPIFDTLSQDSDLKSLIFMKCDVDSEQEISDFFAVSSIPTFLLIKSKGEGTLDMKTDLVKKIVGAKSAFDFKQELVTAIA